MYLNPSTIDDMNMMDCHTLDLATADDCCELVPKREYVHPQDDDDDDDNDDDDDDDDDDDENDDDEDDEEVDVDISDDGDDGDGGGDDDGDDDDINDDDNGPTVGGDGSVISTGSSGNRNRNRRRPRSNDAPGDDRAGAKHRHVADAVLLKIDVGDDERNVVACEGDDNDGGYNDVDIDDDDYDGGGGALAYGNLEMRQAHAIAGADDEEETETLCQLCATAFKTRYNLLRHFQKRHPEYKMYECDLCRITFQSIDEFKDHLEDKHSKVHPTTRSVDSKQVRFACDVCGNMYKNKASAMNHLLTHTAKKTVCCTRCDFTCYTKQQLGVHQTKHDKRFVCDICNKRFAQKSQLDVHVNAVHYNQRPFSCVLCSKSFKTKGSHDAHMIVHTDTRNYQCPHCDKKCRKRYDLTLHIRTHTGEKPFKCSVCGRGFVQMCDTRKHEMLHFRKNKKSSLFFSSSNMMEEDE